MAGSQESLFAANKLSSNAQRLLGDSDHRIIKSGTTTIKFSRISLRNGNIDSTVGSAETAGNLLIHTTWNLVHLPIDPPDIKEMNRLADILELFL